MSVRDIWTIARKELKSCFHDKVILLQIVFVPFLVVSDFIFLMSILGQVSITQGAGEAETIAYSILGMSLPVFLLMAVFTVCMNLAAESIVGEKERGFLNTMLLAPIRRSAIAAGKSLGIFVIALIGGASAFFGMSISLPHMASAMGIQDGISYGVCDYVLLFAATITAVFALASILLIVSTFSKDVKQATNTASVFMIVLTVLSMLTTTDFFRTICDQGGIRNAFIPMWNSALIMQDIIQADFSVLFFAVSCVANLLFCVIAVYVVGRCFENEKIVNA